MTNQDISMMAHLMRRAGFGAPREELEARGQRVRGDGGRTFTPGDAAASRSQRNDALPSVDLARDTAGHGRRGVAARHAQYQAAPEKMALFGIRCSPPGCPK